MRKTVWFLVVVLAFSSFVFSQATFEELTVDKIFHPQKRLPLSGSPTFGIRWTKDGKGFVQPKFGGDGLRIVHVDAQNGRETIFYRASDVNRALTNAGLSNHEASRLANKFALSHNEATQSFLLNSGTDLFIYNAETKTAKRITNNAGKELEADFSPDGKMVSFVQNNDLYVVKVDNGEKIRITFDGAKNILNGFLAWVYEEELYGRGQNRGYWWSPDSKRITFLRTDDSKVPMFVLADDTKTDQEIEDVGYPQAGDPNPIVKLGIAEIEKAGRIPNTGAKKTTSIIDKIKEQAEKVGIKVPSKTNIANPAVRFVNLSKYNPEDFLISRVAWSPDSQNVIFQAQNREQTFLDLNSANVSNDRLTTLFRERSKTWSEAIGNPIWLKDGTFIWRSKRDGWYHLYHYAANGRLIRQITKGNWEIRRFYGIDENNGFAYFSASKHSNIAPQVYRIKLNGTGLTRLTKGEGSHSANFNPTFTHFVHTWSDINTPPQTRLYHADGRLAKVINENKVDTTRKYNLSKPEFMRVRNRDGFEMDAYMIKPPNFDPSKKYPVLSFVYGGPHAPQVRNSWGGSRFLWHQMLAQKGYIIWVCDPRSASGRGERETWTAYKQLGVTEQLDIEDGIRFLKTKPYVDKNRLGIWGWSYGGYMTIFAMTHSKTFKAGISVAPVTDYKLYDSIYTERYMQTPQNNPEGYAKTDLNSKAKNLHGKLLIVHGIMDNNVHMQNTTKFVYELQKAGKQFEFMAYPTQRHSMRRGSSGASQTHHLYQMMTNFILRNL